jgi:hypothetical protein
VISMSQTAHYPWRVTALVAAFGKDAGPAGAHADRLFEELCRYAAEDYFGGEHGRALHFGFPRRVLPAHFPDALDELCAALGEGQGSNRKAPKVDDEKDAKLDIVVWRDFADRRRGKLIGFGQCATGRNELQEKATEMLPAEFAKIWLQKSFLVDPIRMFFVPWRVEDDNWERLCVRGGILMDRCRIASHTRELQPNGSHTAPTTENLAKLRTACAEWSKHVITRLKRSKQEQTRAA